MQHSRRDFLHTAAGATAGLGLVGSLAVAHKPAARAAGPRVRKDIATLAANSPDIVALKKAVGIMMDPNAKIPSCETWANWYGIHGAVNGGFNKCQHGNWYIWPWHRMYVYYFEQIVISLSEYAEFALPYWDWSKNPTIPNPFWQAPLLNTTRVVKQGQSIPTSQFNQFVSPTVINNILNLASFASFGGTANGGGELENTPHNFIHRWIGGDMVTAGSPKDAIFWMHHCNCDRLYSAWISKHPNGLPTSSIWLNRQFNDFCGKGMKVSETSNSVNMGGAGKGYTYDKLNALAFTVRPLPEMESVDGPTTKSVASVGPAAAFALSPKDGAAKGIRRVTAGDVDLRASAISLELHGIKVPENQDVRVSVFINAPKPGPDLTETDPHYVTSFTFFHGPHAAKDDHKEKMKDDGTVTKIVDATQTIRRLFGAQTFGDDETLNVQIVAAPLFPERQKEWNGTVQELSPSEVKIIVSTPKE